MTFPNVNIEKAWNLVTNVSYREKFDTRMIDTKVFHEDEKSVFFYSKGPKSSVGSQREFIMEQFKIRDEGKYIFVGLNRVHSSRPIDTSFFGTKRMFMYFFGNIIEPLDPENPDAGIRMYEVREFDVNGRVPSSAEGWFMEYMVEQTLTEWISLFKNH